MNKKYLIITEGLITEPNFLYPIFKKYGFEVKNESTICIDKCEENMNNVNTDNYFKKYEMYKEDKDLVIIAQGPRNRIRDLMKLYVNQEYNLERFLQIHETYLLAFSSFMMLIKH